MPRKSPRPQKPKVFYVFREDQKGTLKKWIKKGINPFFAIVPILDPLKAPGNLWFSGGTKQAFI